MSTLTQFGGGNAIGAIVPGVYPDNDRFIPCDGAATAPVTSANASLAKIYPLTSTASLQQFSSNYAGFRPYHVAYGNGLWVAVGASGSGFSEAEASYCLTSPDGINWTPRSMPASRVWRNVVWTGSRWAAVGTTVDTTTTTTAQSIDGFTWNNSGFPGSSSPMRYMATTGSRVWVVQVSSSTAYYSDDGTAVWTAAGAVGASTQSLIGFKGAVIASHPSNGSFQIKYNIDTSSWLSVGSVTGITSMATNGSILVCASSTPNQTVTSTDAITFTPRTVPGMYGVIWTGSVFAGFTNGGVYTSPDGITWTVQTSNIFTSSSQKWVGASDGTTMIMVDYQNTPQYSMQSTNGYTFNIRPFPKGGISNVGAYGSIAYNSSLGMYAMGGITDNSIDPTPIILTSTDGITWTERAFEHTNWSIANQTSIQYIVSNGTSFVAVIANNAAYAFVSTDGINWRYRPTTFGGNNGHLTYGNGKYVYCNSAGSLATSTDGVTWTAQTSIGLSGIIGLAWNGTTFAAMTSTGSVSTNATASGAWTAQSAQGGTFVHMIAHGTSFVASLSGSQSSVISSTTATGTWTTRNLPGALNSIRFSSDGTTLVVSPLASPAQTFYTSTNLTAWNTRNLPRPATSQNGVYTLIANGTYFTHDTNSTLGQLCASSVWVSSDAINWAERSFHFSFNTAFTNANIPYYAVLGGKVYVAPSYRPFILSFEENGTVLKPRILPRGNTAGPNTVFNVIASNGTTLVAIGYDSPNVKTVIATSTDGNAWTLRTTPTLPTSVVGGAPTAWTNLIWTGSAFYATSNTFHAMSSTDGITWTVTRLPVSNVGYGTITYGAGMYLLSSSSAVSGSANVGLSMYYTSTDGVTWTPRTMPQKFQVAQNSMYLGSDGTTIILVPYTTSQTSGIQYYVSTDGINWTRRQMPPSGANAGFVGWTGTHFTMGNFASVDAKNWFNTGLPLVACGSPNSNTLYAVSGLTMYVVNVDQTVIKAPQLNSSASNNTPFFQLSLQVG